MFADSDVVSDEAVPVFTPSVADMCKGRTDTSLTGSSERPSGRSVVLTAPAGCIVDAEVVAGVVCTAGVAGTAQVWTRYSKLQQPQLSSYRVPAVHEYCMGLPVAHM